MLEGFEHPSAVGEAFGALPYAEYDLHVCLSQALRAIGLALAPVVVPTLLYALKRSDYFSALVLVDHLLYFNLEGKAITKEMTAANLTRMQREVLRALVEYEDLWEFSEMSFTIGKYFPPQSSWKEIVALLGEKEQTSMELAEFIQHMSILELTPRQAMDLLHISNLNNLDYRVVLEQLRHRVSASRQADQA